MKFTAIISMITLLCTGLSAGIFFAWTVTIIPGLRRIPDETYLKTMQSINRYIQNPWFFIAFIGPVILIPLTAFLLYRQDQMSEFSWVAASAVVYLAGVFGVTMLSNVPMNNKLDKVQLGESNSHALQEVRVAYEKPWNRSNSIRTFSSILAFCLVLFAFIFPEIYQL